MLKALTKDMRPMANAPAPARRPQQPAQTDADIFDDEDQAPESPAAALALRMLSPKQRPQAVKHTTSTPPNPVCAAQLPPIHAPLPLTLPSTNAQQQQQQHNTTETPLHPHEESLKSALAQTQLHIRHKHYTDLNGARYWKGDVAHLRDLVTSAYGKGALGWCDIAQDMVEEERVCQAGRMQQKDVVIGQLRREIEGLRRRLMREISELKRELAELKCPVPWT